MYICSEVAPNEYLDHNKDDPNSDYIWKKMYVFLWRMYIFFF